MARVEALKRKVGWPDHGGEVIAVHVRQRNEKELANFGSGAHRKWDAPTIVRATAALARELGVTDALVLSDDNELVRAVLAGAPADMNFFSTNEAIKHAKLGQDCAREPGTGCDKSVSRVVRVACYVLRVTCDVRRVTCDV